MSQLAYWLHNLDPVAIRFSDGLAIRYYGIAYALSFLAWLLMLWASRRKGKSPLSTEQLVVTMTSLIFAVLLGGRLGYVFLYASGEAWRDPGFVFRVWQGGMSSYGAAAAVALAAWGLSRSFRIPFLRLADLLCPLVPPALLLGRIANFINGELWGAPTSVPWAVVFPSSAPPGTPIGLILPRHPVQLYEAALAGVLLLAFTQWRFWRTDVLDRPGRLSGELMILYALVRTGCELFREPEALGLFGAGTTLLCTAVLGLAGMILVFHSRAARR